MAESAARRTGQRTPLGATSRKNRGSLSGPAVRALAIRNESACGDHGGVGPPDENSRVIPIHLSSAVGTEVPDAPR
jgi:hypothetical protein